ncbi:MAG TPA: SOS response-associated peptidase [Clostridium sp.]|jgi:putative SOS response-associated peptidase YedK|nr:SOS response-associated peptidase [Clostridia bacterium]HCW04751.1 SOS response-associated peptidase [Clostridium sp.]
MCGRYFLALEIDQVIKSYNIKEKILGGIQIGENFPGSNIPVIIRKKGETFLTNILWGIKYLNKNIINGRFETVEEKPLFKGLLEYKRCIIPASSYFEWAQKGKVKEKMEISINDSNLISLAGIYGNFKDKSNNFYESVVILTVPAKDIESIHPRMPLIINKDLIEYWLDPSKSKIDKTLVLEKHYNHCFVRNNCENVEQISFL